MIYLSVALAIALAFAFYGFYTDRTFGRAREIPGPILWGIFSTPTIVGLLFERYWQSRKRVTLWIVSAFAAGINVAVMFAAYIHQWELSIGVLFLGTAAWIIIVFFAAGLFMRHHPGQQ